MKLVWGLMELRLIKPAPCFPIYTHIACNVEFLQTVQVQRQDM